MVTEIEHSLTTGLSTPYGIKNDNNWEQIALCEGWAYHCKDKFRCLYLGNTPNSYLTFPHFYAKMFDDLEQIGCSMTNMEECLEVYTFTHYKELLKAKYTSNAPMPSQIDSIIDYYYTYNF